MSPAILNEIFKNNWRDRKLPTGAENLEEVWSVVVLQNKADEIFNSQHLGLYYGGFLEEREGAKIIPEEYQKLNEALVKNLTPTPEDLDLFLGLQDNPEKHALADLIKKANEDEKLKAVLVELIEKVVSYAENTGDILALAGEDNVIFYPQNDGWNYLLVDALPIHSEPMFKVGRETLQKILQGENITDQEKSICMKALNFVRTINGLSASLGMSSRLKLISSQVNDKEIDFSIFLEK
jgi:hypothetical protein